MFDKAQFLIDGSAEGAIAAQLLVRREVRITQNELLKLERASVNMNQADIDALKKKARELVVAKGHEADINKLIKERQSLQRGIPGGGGGPGYGMTAGRNDQPVKMGRRGREIANQLAYGLGDIMSVQGGAAEMIRASANNVQYMAGMLPGVTGLYAMMGATAAQAFGMIWAKSGEARDRVKESAEATKEARIAWKELVDEVDKATMTEKEYEQQANRRSISEKAGKLLNDVIKKQDVLEELNQKTLGGNLLETLKMIGNTPSEFFGYLAGGREGAIANRTFEQRDQQIKSVQQELAAKNNELRAAEIARDQAILGQEAFKKAKEGLESMSDVKGIKEILQGRYTTTLGQEGKDEAKNELILAFKETVPESMKSAASRMAELMIEEIQKKTSETELKTRMLGLDPAFAESSAARKREEDAKREAEQYKVKALQSDGFMNDLERETYKKLTDAAAMFGTMAKNLEESTKAQQEANRLKAIEIQNQDMPQMQPINPHANE